MTTVLPRAYRFGREVLGPVVGEWCLELWSLAAMIADQGDRSDAAAADSGADADTEPADRGPARLLFCARGGLRLQLAYQTFLQATGLTSPLPVAAFMVSRATAIAPALARALRDGAEAMPPWCATTVGYEFARTSVAGAARALAGVEGRTDDQRWSVPCTPQNLWAYLQHPDGADAASAIRSRADLLTRHVDEILAGATTAVLVDTGLHGTTQQLLAEGLPDVHVVSALLARAYRPGPAPSSGSVVGLLTEADGYRGASPRSTVLRYWHFVEWLFEPELPSVSRYEVRDGRVHADLEIDAWFDRVAATPGTAFAGVLDYLAALRGRPAATVTADAGRAWKRLQRAVVFPRSSDADALAVGERSHGFGLDGTWNARSWRGPLAALSGATMWREGEIARSGTVLRLPLLAAIETAYGVRHLQRRARRQLRRLTRSQRA